MNSFEDVFDNVKKYCLENDKIPEIGITTWIDQMKPQSFNGTDAVFGIQTDFQKNIVMTKYGDILKDAFLNVLGFNVNIVINVDSDEPEKVKVPTDDELEQKHAELEKSYKFANYDYTFDTFIEGRSNEFALACSKSVAKNCGERAVPDYNPLFIYGPSGMGKTHLITAIANEVRKKQPSFNITYVTSETFGNDLVNALNTSHISNFQDKYRNSDILLIDDIQFSPEKNVCRRNFSIHSISFIRRADRSLSRPISRRKSFLPSKNVSEQGLRAVLLPTFPLRITKQDLLSSTENPSF